MHLRFTCVTWSSHFPAQLLNMQVRKFSVGQQKKKLTNIQIELHKSFICFLFNDKATFLSLQLSYYWGKDALKELQKTFEILLKLLFEVYFSYFLEQKKYTNSLVNATFGSWKKSCSPKIMLSKLTGITFYFFKKTSVLVKEFLFHSTC